jgi:hypothetical protein
MEAKRIFIEGIISEHKAKTKEELLVWLVEKEIIPPKNVGYWAALHLFPQFCQKMQGADAIREIAKIIYKAESTVNYIVYNLRNKFK